MILSLPLMQTNLLPWAETKKGKYERSFAASLNLNEFVISYPPHSFYFVEIAFVRYAGLAERLRIRKRVLFFYEIDVYKFCITFECENIPEHWISVLPISNQYTLLSWCLNGLDWRRGKGLTFSTFFRVTRRDWMKSYFHLYYVSYANGKYVSHGLRLYSQHHLFVNLSRCSPAKESLEDVFHNTKRQP